MHVSDELVDAIFRAAHNDWTGLGVLQFDFVAAPRPSENARPLEDSALRSLLRRVYLEEGGPRHQRQSLTSASRRREARKPGSGARQGQGVEEPPLLGGGPRGTVWSRAPLGETEAEAAARRRAMAERERAMGVLMRGVEASGFTAPGTSLGEAPEVWSTALAGVASTYGKMSQVFDDEHRAAEVIRSGLHGFLPAQDSSSLRRILLRVQPLMRSPRSNAAVTLQRFVRARHRRRYRKHSMRMMRTGSIRGGVAVEGEQSPSLSPPITPKTSGVASSLAADDSPWAGPAGTESGAISRTTSARSRSVTSPRRRARGGSATRVPPLRGVRRGSTVVIHPALALADAFGALRVSLAHAYVTCAQLRAALARFAPVGDQYRLTRCVSGQ